MTDVVNNPQASPPPLSQPLQVPTPKDTKEAEIKAQALVGGGGKRKSSKKKVVVAILLAAVTLTLSVVAVVTALRLRQIGTKPVAPTAPESKPKAAEGVELVENTDPRILYTGTTNLDQTGLQVGVTYTGNWDEVTFAGASGGTVHEVASRQTDMAGIKLAFTFNGSGPIVFNYQTYVSTAWNTPNCPGCGVAYHGGEAEVWIDGENKGKITFHEPVGGAAQLKNRTYFVGSSGTHTIEIKKVWIPTQRTDVPQRISLDAFYVSGVTQPSPTPPATCNQTCGGVVSCASGLTCSVGVCRNPTCLGETDCVCALPAPSPSPSPSPAPSPSPSPKPVSSCQGSCVLDSDCSGSLICDSGVCANALCPGDSDCQCAVGGTKPRPTPTPTPQEVEEVQLPEAGITLPTIGLLTAGLTTLMLGIVALLL